MYYVHIRIKQEQNKIYEIEIDSIIRFTHNFRVKIMYTDRYILSEIVLTSIFDMIIRSITKALLKPKKYIILLCLILIYQPHMTSL